MKEETSSVEMLSKVGWTTTPAGSLRVLSDVGDADADCVDFLPVKTSQTPILPSTPPEDIKASGAVVDDEGGFHFSFRSSQGDASSEISRKVVRLVVGKNIYLGYLP